MKLQHGQNSAISTNQAHAGGDRAPFDLTVLTHFGVSAQLADQYAASGWLVRLAHGVQLPGRRLELEQEVKPFGSWRQRESGSSNWTTHLVGKMLQSLSEP
ncbi:hypothetical protein CBM2626_U30019 [Cupriavidus taiwanensis]|nr:hypothetical protein CBM2626_U30019 [Cupriavidus taiwanensis]